MSIMCYNVTMTYIEHKATSKTCPEADDDYRGITLILGDPHPDDDPAKMPVYPPLTSAEREVAIQNSIAAAAELAVSAEVPDHLLWAHNAIRSMPFPSV